MPGTFRTNRRTGGRFRIPMSALRLKAMEKGLGVCERCREELEKKELFKFEGKIYCYQCLRIMGVVE